MAEQKTQAEPVSQIVDSVARVDLRVRDIGAALGFYEGIAGLEVDDKTRDRASLRSPGAETIIRLSSDGVTQPAQRNATGLFHTAIRYPTRRDLGEALARLVAGGYEVGAGDHLVSEALYVDDPDGNGVELYRDRPRDQWPAPGPGERVRMATESVDLPKLLDDAHIDGAIPTRAPTGTDIGHVHLQVSDIDKTTAFYTDVVGLDLMARFGAQAGFFSSNGYHHYIGANIWRSRGQKPASRDHAGLERIVFSVGDREQFDALRARLVARAYEHGGGDREIVVLDPDGIELRFDLRT